MRFAIKVGSVTNAQRGMRALRNKGYKPMLSRIQNPQPNDGCGYVINVTARSKEDIISVLEDIKISVLGVEVK